MRIWGFQNDKYDWTTFDLDRDMPVINSKVGFVDAVDPDLSKFKARGGKLLLYAGWGDTTITPENTVALLRERARQDGPATRATSRACSSSPAWRTAAAAPGLNTFDSIGALEQWREKGEDADAGHRLQQHDADDAAGLRVPAGGEVQRQGERPGRGELELLELAGGR